MQPHGRLSRRLQRLGVPWVDEPLTYKVTAWAYHAFGLSSCYDGRLRDLDFLPEHAFSNLGENLLRARIRGCLQDLPPRPKWYLLDNVVSTDKTVRAVTLSALKEAMLRRATRTPRQQRRPTRCKPNAAPPFTRATGPVGLADRGAIWSRLPQAPRPAFPSMASVMPRRTACPSARAGTPRQDSGHYREPSLQATRTVFTAATARAHTRATVAHRAGCRMQWLRRSPCLSAKLGSCHPYPSASFWLDRSSTTRLRSYPCRHSLSWPPASRDSLGLRD